jgi:hypothetical protein
MTSLKPGDRVKYSAEWLTTVGTSSRGGLRAKDKRGRFIRYTTRVGEDGAAAGLAVVLWDGSRTATRYHPSFIEADALELPEGVKP